MDLTGWDFAADGVVHLDGEWEFYWNKLLEPDQIPPPPFFKGGESIPTPSENRRFLEVPGFWSDNEHGGAPFEDKGYATYRLTVMLPPEAPGLAISGPWDLSTAFRIYVDGKLAVENGVVGTNKETMVPERTLTWSAFTPQPTTTEIVLQFSNFNLRKGGPMTSLFLGRPEDLVRKSGFVLAVDLLILGAVFIMCLYHLMLYLLRKSDVAHLVFSGFCLSWGIFIATAGMGSYILIQLFPGSSWESMMGGLSLASLPPGCVLGLIFIRLLFPDEIHLKSYIVFVAIYVVFGVIFLVGFLVTEFDNLLLLNIIFDFISIVLIIYILWVLLRAISRKREGAKVFISGCVIILFACINDTLYISQFINTTLVFPLGIFAFICSQSYVLSKRYTSALAELEALYIELKEKLLLEREVAEGKRSEAIAQERADYEARDKLRYQLGPHFLFNTLNSVRRLISKDAEHAREMVSKLADLSRLILARRSVEFVTLREEIEMIRLYLDLEQGRYQDYLSVSIEADKEAGTIEIPCFVLQPLVENAIKYGKVTSPESLEIAITSEVVDGNLRVRVANTGHWVTDEERGAVPSTGFGLENVQKRLQGHYADAFRFDTNELDEWVRVEVVIPLEGKGQ